MKTTRRSLLALALLSYAIAGPAGAQGQLVLAKVHGYSLEDTVTGESPDRSVAVYLPPSYASSPERRYPVLYLLHGIGGTHADWTQAGSWRSIQDVMDRGIAMDRIAEMIVIAPDQRTRGGGSFYVNSSVTGGWEDFTAFDLVDYTDSTYRTLARASSRGIAGHSMGGYGAIRMGMHHPDVFQVVYGMNSALLGFAGDLTEENQGYARAASVRPEDVNPRADFMVASLLCVAQALSPDPDRPPFFAQLPYAPVEGRLEPTAAHELWKRAMPLYQVEHHVDALRSLRALRFDSGRYDEYTHIPPTNRALSERLTELAVPHVFEDYNGDHRDRMWGEEGRLATEVLPFFSRMLETD